MILEPESAQEVVWGNPAANIEQENAHSQIKSLLLMCILGFFKYLKGNADRETDWETKHLVFLLSLEFRRQKK